jgi:hypothetical protein
MSSVTYTTFQHSWIWKSSEGKNSTQEIKNLIKAKVSAQTGKNWLYTASGISGQNSFDQYKRADIQIMAIDPITLSIIAMSVAGILMMIYAAIKGQPVSVGFNPATLQWYVSTDGHTIVGDTGNAVTIPNPEGSPQAESLFSSPAFWIVIIIIAIIVLMMLIK